VLTSPVHVAGCTITFEHRLMKPLLVCLLLSLWTLQVLAYSEEEILAGCESRAGRQGVTAVRNCVAEDVAAAEALANYPETAEGIVRRCRVQLKYVGWARVKACADKGIAAREALSAYPEEHQSLVEGCRIRMEAFGWHMVKACADRDIEARKGMD
jgi:hypothetical protein